MQAIWLFRVPTDGSFSAPSSQPRLMEFIEGAGRLRGNAKALDIWRVETKLEVRACALACAGWVSVCERVS